MVKVTTPPSTYTHPYNTRAAARQREVEEAHEQEAATQEVSTFFAGKKWTVIDGEGNPVPAMEVYNACIAQKPTLDRTALRQAVERVSEGQSEGYADTLMALYDRAQTRIQAMTPNAKLFDIGNSTTIPAPQGYQPLWTDAYSTADVMAAALDFLQTGPENSLHGEKGDQWQNWKDKLHPEAIYVTYNGDVLEGPDQIGNYIIPQINYFLNLVYEFDHLYVAPNSNCVILGVANYQQKVGERVVPDPAEPNGGLGSKAHQGNFYNMTEFYIDRDPADGRLKIRFVRDVMLTPTMQLLKHWISHPSDGAHFIKRAGGAAVGSIWKKAMSLFGRINPFG